MTIAPSGTSGPSPSLRTSTSSSPDGSASGQVNSGASPKSPLASGSEPPPFSSGDPEQPASRRSAAAVAPARARRWEVVKIYLWLLVVMKRRPPPYGDAVACYCAGEDLVEGVSTCAASAVLGGVARDR